MEKEASWLYGTRLKYGFSSSLWKRNNCGTDHLCLLPLRMGLRQEISLRSAKKWIIHRCEVCPRLCHRNPISSLLQPVIPSPAALWCPLQLGGTALPRVPQGESTLLKISKQTPFVLALSHRKCSCQPLVHMLTPCWVSSSGVGSCRSVPFLGGCPG